jgi:hypothetical protein
MRLDLRIGIRTSNSGSCSVYTQPRSSILAPADRRLRAPVALVKSIVVHQRTGGAKRRHDPPVRPHKLPPPDSPFLSNAHFLNRNLLRTHAVTAIHIPAAGISPAIIKTEDDRTIHQTRTVAVATGSTCPVANL